MVEIMANKRMFSGAELLNAVDEHECAGRLSK